VTGGAEFIQHSSRSDKLFIITAGVSIKALALMEKLRKTNNQSLVKHLLLHHIFAI